MPIFEVDGQQFEVEDKYVSDFAKEYPNAVTKVDSEEAIYEVSASDYPAYLDTQRAPRRVVPEKTTIPGSHAKPYQITPEEMGFENVLDKDNFQERYGVSPSVMERQTDPIKESVQRLRAKVGSRSNIPQYPIGNRYTFGFGSDYANKEADKIAESQLSAATENELRGAEKAQSKDGFWKSFGKGLKDEGMWTQGLTELDNNLTLAYIAKKAEKEGFDKLPEKEQDLLTASALRIASEAANSDEKTALQIAGMSTAESIPYMLQFMLTSSPASLATSPVRSAIKKAAEKAIKSGISSKLIPVVKGAARTASVGAKATAMTAMQPTMYADMVSRGTGRATLENGQYAGMEEAESAPMAAYKAFANATIENLSEHSGSMLSGATKAAGNVLKKVPALGGFISNAQRNNVLSGVNKMMKAVGFNGAPEEFFEEQVSTGLNSLLVGDSQFSDFVDWKQQLATLISVGATAGAMTTTGTIMSVPYKKEIKRKYEEATDKVYEYFTPEEFDQFSSSLSRMDIDSRPDFIAQVSDMKGFAPEQIYSLVEFATRQAQFDGYAGAVSDYIEDEKVRAQEEIDRVSNKNMGEVIQVNGFGENPVNIVGGFVVFDDEGFVDKKKSSQTIYYLDEDGKRKMASPDKFGELVSRKPLSEAYAEVLGNVENDILIQEENDLSEEDTPEQAQQDAMILAENGSQVETPDGVGTISQVEQDENAAIVTFQDGRSKRYSIATLKPYVDPNLQPVENIAQTEAPISQTEIQTEQPLQPAQDGTQVVEQPAYVFPVDKEGNIDYTQINEPEQYAQALQQEFEGDAVSVIDEQIQSAQAKLEKAGKNTDAIKKRRAMKAAQMELDRLNNVKSLLTPSEQIVSETIPNTAENEEASPSEQSNVTDLSQLTEPERRRYVVDNSTDPIELAEIYEQSKDEVDYAQMMPWEAALVGRKVSKDSFMENSDKNNITGAMSRSWFSKDGKSLDVLAQELSEFGVPVTEQDIVNFMMSHPGNSIKKRSQLSIDADRRFKETVKELTGQDVGGVESSSGKLILAGLRAGQRSEQERQALPFSTYTIPDSVLNFFEETGINPEDFNTFEELRDAVVQEQESGTFVFPLGETDLQIINNIINHGIEQQQDYANFAARVEKAGTQRAAQQPIFETAAGTQLEPITIEPRTEAGTESTEAGTTEQVTGEEIEYTPEDMAEIDAAIETRPLIEVIQDAAVVNEINEAEKDVDVEPTEAQKEAGNYKKGHIKLNGFDITIENPKGSQRSGTDADGKPWSIEMANSYGYIKGTKGKDNDQVDVFLGDSPLSDKVFIVDQINKDGSFDEHKVMIGFNSKEEAEAAYLANYEKGWTGLGSITEMPVDEFREWVKEGKKVEPAPVEGKRTFVDAVKAKLGKESMNIVSLRKMAAESGLTDVKDTTIQEYVELALIEKAKEIANEDISTEERYQKIVDLYNNQPTISMRSSERIEKQQYSTPLPMAFLAGEYVKTIEINRALEPSSGNGMMVFNVPTEKVIANEIDEVRLDNLREQPFLDVMNQDATTQFNIDPVDAVIMNPPFGKSAARDYDGYKIAGLDEQMVVNALSNLKPDGKASIIIGGHTKYKENGTLASEKAFFGYLYNYYNVTDVINIGGSLYSKQGTSFPVRLILINGRRNDNSRVYAPLQKDARAEAVTTFEELYNRVNERINEKDLLLQEPTDSNNDGTGVATGGTDGGHSGNGNTKTSGKSGKRGGKSGTSSAGPDLFSGHSDKAKPSNSDTNADGRDIPHPTGSEGGTDVYSRQGVDRRVREQDVLQFLNRTDELGGNDVKVDLDSEKTKYPAKSKSGEIGSVVPTNVAQPLAKVLSRFKDIDSYVQTKLGYPSKEDLYNALAAEQIDSVAMAIYQIENGKALIIGDMTGVGKGRQAAAIIRYATLEGKKPIFITEKAHLFSDMYRDLLNIGSGALVPFMLNSKSQKSDPTITDKDGVVVYKPLSEAKKNPILKSGKLPDEYDYIMLTYSQMNTDKEKGSVKQSFISSMAEGNIIVMDESHNAGGDGNTGAFLRDVLPTTQGVAFLSGTFAKRPDNMPIYALKTSMNEANMSNDELIAAIAKGGVPLQEIMSKNLVESGQMVRRERDFAGVKIDWLTLDESKDEHYKAFDAVIGMFNELISFQSEYIAPIISGINDDLADTQGEADFTKGTKDLGVSNTPFASKTFNVVRQLLFSLKAKDVARYAIEELKAGKKPVIAVSNTMEGFMNELGAIDEVLTDYDFSITLKKGLDGQFRYTVTDAFGKKTQERIELSELPREGQEKYHELIERINKMSSGITISPIDVIRDTIEKAGYRVGELTGRTNQLEFNDDGTAVIKKRTDTDKKKLARDFNSGELDALILNQSASTGISLHASSEFKDQKPRVMISAQTQLDVNTEVQMRGRVDRTGQVHRGEYKYICSPIPAEQRLVMMFKAKLKSLDANTTSNQKSKANDIDIVDFLNKYGDEVCIEYLKENPEINEKMLDPEGISGLSEDELAKLKSKDATASRVAGRAALLSVAEQEQFYKEISEKYMNVINYLNDNNSNDLEITTLPLRAETKESVVVVKGVGTVGNPFAQDSIREAVEIDVLKKPMKSEDVKAEIERLTGGLSPKDYIRKLVDEVEIAQEEHINRETKKGDEAFKKKQDDLREKKYKQGKRKGLEGEALESFVRDALIEQHLANAETEVLRLQNIENRYNSIKKIFKMFPTGRILMVPNSLNIGATTTYTEGVLMGYKIKPGQYSPSSITASFATLDSRRRVDIPLSKFDFLNAVYSETMQNLDFIKTDLNTWDSKIPTKTRRTGYIVTGNVLQAYGVIEGQLVSYSTVDGGIKQGILLPENYEPKGQKKRVMITESINDLLSGMDIADSSGDVKLEKEGSKGYAISVPLSKVKGGKYFLDSGLRSFIMGGDFKQMGNKMVGYIKESNIREAVSYLSDKYSLTTDVAINDASSKKDVRFRDSNAAQNDVTDVEKGIINISETLNAPVRIIRDVNEITNEDKRKEKRMRSAKGWYDPKTGEVVIVLPNAESVGDIQATILHEVVGHKGLRGLLGDKFEEMMDKVYKHLPKKERQKIMAAAMDKYKFDYRTATEEYLAEFVERDVMEPSLWQKIKSAIKSFFRNMGVNLEMSDPDIAYLLWKSKNRLQGGDALSKINSVAKDLEAKERFREAPYTEADVLSDQLDDASKRAWESLSKDQRTVHEMVNETAELRKGVLKYFPTKEGVKKSIYELTQGLFDNAVSLKALQNLVNEVSNEPIESYANPYQFLTTIPARNEHKMKTFVKTKFSKIGQAIKEMGVPQSTVQVYAYLKHGIERNRYMRGRDIEDKTRKLQEEAEKRIDPIRDSIEYLSQQLETADKKNTQRILAKIEGYNQAILDIQSETQVKASEYAQKVEDKDYSGVFQVADLFIQEMEDRKMTVAQIESAIEQFEKEHDTTNFWEAVNGATKWTVQNEFEMGRISKDVRDKIFTMYEYYIPLKGWEEENANEVWDYMSGQGIPVSPIKKAGGRKSLAQNPFENIGLAAQTSIMGGHKNLLKLHALRMVRNYPNKLYRVSEVWVVDEGDSWVMKAPEYSDNAETYAENVIKFEEEMNELKEQGLAKKVMGKLDVGKPITKYEAKEHEVLVYENGKPYIIYINDNPDIARAINMTSTKPYEVGGNDPSGKDWMKKGLNGAMNLMRFTGQNLTSGNPAFVAANLVMDTQWAIAAASAKEGSAYAKKLVGNYMSSSVHSSILRGVRGKLDESNPMDKMFADFQRAGGETGYSDLFKLEDFQMMLKEGLNEGTDWRKIYTWYTGSIDMLNRWAELASRFSTFVTSRNSGRDIERSAYDAKEITLNFNRKGTGAFLGNWLKFAYLFAGAGLQGAYSMANLALSKRSQKRITMVFAGTAMLGLIIPLINDMFLGGDDDELYSKKPDYERKSNFLIRIPGSDSFFKLPISQPLRPFYNIGETLYQMVKGNRNAGEGTMDIIGGFGMLLPFDPFGGSSLVPSAFQPVFQVKENKDFFGQKIYKDDSFTQYDPEFKRAFSNTSPAFVELTRALNEITGGDEVTRGMVNVNPAILEHLVEGYLGGAFKFVNDIGKQVNGTIEVYKGNAYPYDSRSYPIVGRFYTNTAATSDINAEYYKVINDSEELNHRVRKYQELGRKGDQEAFEKSLELMSSPEYKKAIFVKAFKKRIDNLKKTAKDGNMENNPVLKDQERELKIIMLNEIEKLDEK